MSWLNEEIAEKWRSEGKKYASSVNEYVRIGMESNWEIEQEEPEQDERARLATAVVKMIRAANQKGDFERLRKEIPPASWPLTSVFDGETQGVKTIGFLKDGGLLVHAGGLRDIGTSYVIYQEQITELSGISRIGCSVDGNYFALANQDGIRIVRGMERSLQAEEETAFFEWKNIKNSIKATIPGMESLADEEHPETLLDEVIPFDDGKKLLLVCGYGIYLISNEKIELLHPNAAELLEDEIEDTSIDMGHGAVSPDGQWIAYGSQCSEHLLKNLTDGTVYEFAPESSYPHYALFSTDSQEVWYNACHFYNGVTIRVPITAALEHTISDSTEEWPIMNEEMRVYAAVALKNHHILGDAYGYLRCMDREGQEVWRYFVGSTISGITVSEDEKYLAAGTYGGMLHLIDLSSGSKSEYSIGTADIVEIDRWILWKNQEPLRW